MPRKLPKNFIIIIFTIYYIFLMMQCGFCHTKKIEENHEFIKFDTDSNQDTVKLECKFLKYKLGRSSPSSVNEVYWEHKKCGIGLDLVPCHLADNIPWQTVMCKNHSKICDVFSLKLNHPTKNMSGLYRCNVKNYIAKEFKTFKTFQLDVIDPKADVRILNEHYDTTKKANTNNVNFDNQTVHINGTALFRCRVQSLLSVNVFWGKASPGMKLSDEKCDNFKTPIKNQSYDILVPSKLVKVDKNLYITKLRLEKIQPYDSGSYFCIAVASTAQDLILKCKMVYLNVPETFPDDDSSSLLWLLIFIPIFIVFVTILVCVCHVHVYRLKSRKISNFYK